MLTYENLDDIPNDGSLHAAITTVIYGRLPLRGFRDEHPGVASIDEGLEAAGIIDKFSHHPFKFEHSMGVPDMTPQDHYDLIMSMVYTPEQLANLGPETPGFTALKNGLAQRGIWSSDGGEANLATPNAIGFKGPIPDFF